MPIFGVFAQIIPSVFLIPKNIPFSVPLGMTMSAEKQEFYNLSHFSFPKYSHQNPMGFTHFSWLFQVFLKRKVFI